MPSFDEILARLKRQIAVTVASNRVRRFYIGRSVNVDVKEGDDVRYLYETRSLNRALDLQDALVRHFYNHPKNDNWQEHAGGNVAEGIQRIYIALWVAA